MAFWARFCAKRKIRNQLVRRRMKQARMIKRPKPFSGIRKFVRRKQPVINEVVREPTAGGVVFRRSPKDPSVIEILLIADSKNRWTIPKGHIEEGETPKQTAEREIQEETGLQKMKVMDWLGKINFRYRRINV